MKLLTLVSLSALALVDVSYVFGVDFETLAAQSQFVFKGTVRKIRAVTLPEIQPNARTVVVRVDEVLKPPPGPGRDYTGQEITVQLAKPKTARNGQQLVFFTTSWMFGRGIAVREIGRLPPEPDSSPMRARLADATARASDSKLQERLRGAELVLSGRVLAARPATAVIRSGPVSEHSLHWWEANIQVELIEKGQFPGRSVVVLIPYSDGMRQALPRLREGQEGIWILHRETLEGEPAQRSYKLGGPLDFQPKGQLDWIRRLLK